MAELQVLTQDGAWRARYDQAPGTLLSLEDLARLSDDSEALIAHLRDPHPGSAPRR